MGYNDDIKEVKALIKDKKLQEAEVKLHQILEGSSFKVVEDDEWTYHSFNSYLQALIDWNMNRPKKKNKLPDINYAEVYFYLGFINTELKNYEKSIEWLKKGLERNPVDILIMFELSAVHRMSGNIEKARAHIEKLHPYIMHHTHMAKFYRELGWYYAERRVFDVANALYSQSMIYQKTELAENELKYIAGQENREYRLSTKEEIRELLPDYNIPLGFSLNTINILYSDYKNMKEKHPDSKEITTLARALYDMTLDKQFFADTGWEEPKEETKVENKEEPKVENASANQVQNVQIIECPLCNKTFEFSGVVPETQKTFYCTCPHCGAELKRGNPNYTGW